MSAWSAKTILQRISVGPWYVKTRKTRDKERSPILLFVACRSATNERVGRAAFRACLKNYRFPEVFPYECSISLAQAQNPTSPPQAPFATGRRISDRTTTTNSTYPTPIFHLPKSLAYFHLHFRTARRWLPWQSVQTIVSKFANRGLCWSVSIVSFV